MSGGRTATPTTSRGGPTITAGPPPPSPLLSVTGLTTQFTLPTGVVRAVEDVSLEIREGETLGLVGDSGSGKSATLMSILGLLPPNGRVVAGEVAFEGRQLLDLPNDAMRRVRGSRIALVPQNPLAALNPVFTIGWQLSEALTVHAHMTSPDARRLAIESLARVGLPEPEAQLDRYPHEFSGGMRQRILIAMAIINRPTLLLADEPTTALDTTTQAQILRLLGDLVREFRMSLLLITHNIGVVATIARRVAVMHAGEIVETGPTREVFARPLHPYTKLLISSSPVLRADAQPNAAPEPNSPASPQSRLAETSRTSCRFRPRCPIAVERCSVHPDLEAVGSGYLGRAVRCWVAGDRANGDA